MQDGLEHAHPRLQIEAPVSRNKPYRQMVMFGERIFCRPPDAYKVDKRATGEMKVVIWEEAYEWILCGNTR